MTVPEDKRGRGRGPNAVRGHELAQQGRLSNLEGVDEELKAEIEALKQFALDMAARVDELAGGEEPAPEEPVDPNAPPA